MKDNNKGFTYMEILVSVMVLFFTLLFFSQLEKYNNNIKLRTDEESRMVMVAQGVMDAYRKLGKDEALNYVQGYTVDITETDDVENPGLVKVVINVSPKISGVNAVKVASYHR